MLTAVDWDIPESLEEAETRRRVLVAEIQEIQAQLGDRLRRKNTDEYWSWRTSATWALTNRLQELRLIKKWQKDQQHEIGVKNARW